MRKEGKVKVMKITEEHEGMAIKGLDWEPNKWITVTGVGNDYFLAVNQQGAETIFPIDRVDWALYRSPLQNSELPPKVMEVIFYSFKRFLECYAGKKFGTEYKESDSYSLDPSEWYKNLNEKLGQLFLEVNI